MIIQKGHVDRTKGATGTAGEQNMTSPVADLAAAKLRAYGHSTKVVLADERWNGDADCFFAIHGDGSTNRNASGAVVGYPDPAGGVLAQAWKRAYDARGWPYGWKPDNWTPAIRGYYGYRAYAQCERRMVIEVGFMTHPTKDRPWIDAHHGTIAQSIADAVGAVYGHPAGGQPAPIEGDTDVLKRGDRGNEVVVMQWWVNEVLHGAADAPAGVKADGDYGPATEAAVKQVQAKFGYHESGVWDLSVATRVSEIRVYAHLERALRHAGGGQTPAPSPDQVRDSVRRLVPDLRVTVVE